MLTLGLLCDDGWGNGRIAGEGPRLLLTLRS